MEIDATCRRCKKSEPITLEMASDYRKRVSHAFSEQLTQELYDALLRLIDNSGIKRTCYH